MLPIETLKKKVAELHSLVQTTLQKNRAQGRKTASKRVLPNFCRSYLVLMARNLLIAGEKSSLCCRGARRIARVLKNYVCEVKHLPNEPQEAVNISPLRFITIQICTGKSSCYMSYSLKPE